MTDEELAEIETRANAAAEGPWWAQNAGDIVKFVRQGQPEDNGDYIAETTYIGDARFIAHARTDIPRLLAEIRRLKNQP